MNVPSWLEGFIFPGFYTLGLITYFLFFGWIGNGIYSLLIVLKKGIGDSIAKIATVALGLGLLGTVFLLLATPGPFGIPEVFGTVFWSWYFIFIPQFLIFMVCGTKMAKSKGIRIIKIVLRIVLTLLVPFLLCFLHSSIGVNFLHITPD